MHKMLQRKIRWLALALPLFLLGSVVGSEAGRAYCRSEFRRYFEGLSSAGVVSNPVQRVIFSLMLANAEPASKPQPSAPQQHL